MRLALAVVAALAVAGLASPALAQAPGATPPVEAPKPTEIVDEKQPEIAVMLSVGTTLAGFATIAVGDEHETAALVGLALAYVGPATGQWYAGRFGGYGLAARAVAGVGFVYGIGMLLSGDGGCEADRYDDCSAFDARVARDERRGKIALAASSLLWIGSSVYDVVKARDAANEWNRDHAVTIAPVIAPQSAGLSVIGRF